MTANNVALLPVWKKDATAEEWFYEMAMLARQYPERFKRAVIVYDEEKPNGNTLTRYACRNTSTTELLGLLEIGKQEVLDYTRNRL